MPDIVQVKAQVKDAVKESLLGSSEPASVQLSAQTRLTFEKHAIRNPETGELYMGEEQFVDAIAPKDEDYVSHVLIHDLSGNF